MRDPQRDKNLLCNIVEVIDYAFWFTEESVLMV